MISFIGWWSNRSKHPIFYQNAPGFFNQNTPTFCRIKIILPKHPRIYFVKRHMFFSPKITQNNFVVNQAMLYVYLWPSTSFLLPSCVRNSIMVKVNTSPSDSTSCLRQWSWKINIINKIQFTFYIFYSIISLKSILFWHDIADTKCTCSITYLFIIKLKMAQSLFCLLHCISHLNIKIILLALYFPFSQYLCMYVFLLSYQ